MVRRTLQQSVNRYVILPGGRLKTGKLAAVPVAVEKVQLQFLM